MWLYGLYFMAHKAAKQCADRRRLHHDCGRRITPGMGVPAWETSGMATNKASAVNVLCITPFHGSTS